jgi:peptide/nickel transport system substrate-binding protein
MGIIWREESFLRKHQGYAWLGVVALAGWAALGSTALAQDTLRIVLAEEPTSLDPCETNGTNNSQVLRNNITETLVRVDPANGEVIAGLATSWEQTAPNAFRFHLQPDVVFHDGTPFTADAVAQALTRAQDEALNCSIRGSKLGTNPFTATVVDPLTVDVTGERPDPTIPYRMAVLDIGSPAATPRDAKSDAPVGTGPYKFVSWQRGQKIDLVANDAYWGDKPNIVNVSFTSRAEPSVRAAMVDNGEADMAFGIAPQDATSPLDRTYLNAEETFIRMDTRLEPFSDIRVRKAANLALDRDAMIGTIFHADAQKATQMIIPSVNGYSPDIEPWPFDPEQARALIAAARADGVDTDAEIVFYGRTGQFPNVLEALEAVQAMLMDVGLNVRLEMMEPSVWLAHLLKPFDDETQANMLASMSDNTMGDAVFTIGPKFRSDGNQATIEDPLVDALIDLGTNSTGTLRRNAFRLAYEYMQKQVIPTIDLMYMVGTVRVAETVEYTPDVQTGNEIKLKTISFR